MRDDVVQRHHISDVDVDVQQVDQVHDLTTLADSFARHDDPKAVNGVSTRRVYAVAGAEPRDNQRVYALSREHLVESRCLETRGEFLEKQLLVGTALQTWVQIENVLLTGCHLHLELLVMG